MSLHLINMATSSSGMTQLCELTATVPTGLEGGAADEFKEKLGRNAEAARGRVKFNILSLEELKLVRNDLCVVVAMLLMTITYYVRLTT